MTPRPGQTVPAPPTTVLPLGPLAPFHAAGVLGVADIHVAAGLLRRTPQGPQALASSDLPVPLGIALCVRALRDGSVCLSLDEDPIHWLPAEPADTDPRADPGEAPLPWPDAARWGTALAAHPLVAVGPEGGADRPLRLVDDRLYLQRYWADEQLIAAQIQARSRTLDVDPLALRDALVRLFPQPGADAQRLAVAMAATRASAIITGGPGTGKTTTVAQLLAALCELDPGLTIGLAAPTGKAAARLQEAIAEALDTLGGADLARVGHPEARTLHRLLGWVPSSQSRFRHHAGNPLPHDVVIVDECSMVALPMMARLLEAVRPDARLVLVGDADQLASVDAGAVLDDLVAAAPPWASAADKARAEEILATACPDDAPGAAARRGVVRLVRVRRFGERIARMSAAIQAGDPAVLMALLAASDDEVTFTDTSDPAARAAALTAVGDQVARQGEALRTAGEAGDAASALVALDELRVLCAHRRGPDGVRTWNELIDAWTQPPAVEWYPGRPILITRNDPGSGVANGDTGVAVQAGDGTLRAAFARGADPLLLAPGRLEAVESLRAMTIHRAQGSQFQDVTVVLPAAGSPLLTRELLYTAVTRARRSVRILGTPAAVEAAVTTRVRRASGLRQASTSVDGPD